MLSKGKIMFPLYFLCVYLCDVLEAKLMYRSRKSGPLSTVRDLGARSLIGQEHKELSGR